MTASFSVYLKIKQNNINKGRPKRLKTTRKQYKENNGWHIKTISGDENWEVGH